jgi:hypothetical protein
MSPDKKEDPKPCLEVTLRKPQDTWTDEDYLIIKEAFGLTHHSPCPHPLHDRGPKVCPLCRFLDVKRMIAGMDNAAIAKKLKEVKA